MIRNRAIPPGFPSAGEQRRGIEGSLNAASSPIGQDLDPLPLWHHRTVKDRDASGAVWARSPVTSFAQLTPRVGSS
jgi:hypothetical protein